VKQAYQNESSRRNATQQHHTKVVSAERPQSVTPGSPIARVIAARSPVFLTVEVDSGEGQVAGACEWLGVPLLTSGAVIGALVV